IRCKALKPTSDPRLQDFLGTLQSFEAYTPKIPGQGYFIFPEILGVHVNSPAMFFCWLGCVDAPDEEGAIEAAANARKHSWECSALPSSGGRGHSCECSAPLGCYTRPPNSTLSPPFPGMTNIRRPIGIPFPETCGE